MNILAIETTGKTASVTIMTDNRMLYSAKSNDEMSHLKDILLLISKALQKAGISKNDINMIAVSAGPGSFTGIRIGMATAKTLAQAWNIPIAAVPTLLSFAEARAQADIMVCPMIDARRGEVYAGAYAYNPAGLNNENPEKMPYTELIGQDAYKIEDFLHQATESAVESREKTGGMPAKIVLYGDAPGKYTKQVETAVKNAESQGIQMIVAEDGEKLQNSEYIAKAAQYLKKSTYLEVEPVYLKKAEAERKLNAGMLGKKKQSRQSEKTIFELPPADEKINIRQVTLQDVPDLAALDAQCFEKAWSGQSFRSDLEGPRKAFYVAAENSKGEIIGFAGMVYLLDEGEINRVAVNPLYRLRGISDLMMNEVISQAESLNLRSITLEVREANRTAITLYKNHGFSVDTIRRGYYAETGENALLMSWHRQ